MFKKNLLFLLIILFHSKFVLAETKIADWTRNADAKARIINNDGKKIGDVYAKQGTEGVVLRLHVTGLTPGIHGMHFHNIGDCTNHKNFKSAGDHIDPQPKPHGFFHPKGPHEGNLPNLIVDESGKANVELYSQMISIKNGETALLDDDGSALVIHDKADDHLSQPIGGSGGRMACGVFKPFEKTNL